MTRPGSAAQPFIAAHSKDYGTVPGRVYPNAGAGATIAWRKPITERNLIKRLPFRAVVLFSAVHGSGAIAQGVGSECRGVAAGIVSSMQASGEIAGAVAADAAFIAAERACLATLQGRLGAGVPAQVPAVVANPAQPASGYTPAAVAANAPQTGAEYTPVAVRQAEADAEEDDEDESVWDLLTKDRNTKPGHERLRRLRN